MSRIFFFYSAVLIKKEQHRKKAEETQPKDATMDDIWAPAPSRTEDALSSKTTSSWIYVVVVQTILLFVLAWMIRPSCFLTKGDGFEATRISVLQILVFSIFVSVATAYAKGICHALGSRPPFLRV